MASHMLGKPPPHTKLQVAPVIFFPRPWYKGHLHMDSLGSVRRSARAWHPGTHSNRSYCQTEAQGVRGPLRSQSW